MLVSLIIHKCTAHVRVLINNLFKGNKLKVKLYTEKTNMVDIKKDVVILLIIDHFIFSVYSTTHNIRRHSQKGPRTLFIY